jgi:hypothetical protein
VYVYRIELKFGNNDALPEIPKDKLCELLNNAREIFNQNYLINHQGNKREMKNITLNENSFDIILSSDIKLDRPSKAIVKFSRALVESGAFDAYIYNNRLLRSVSVEDISENIQMTDCELLTTITEWILNASLDSPTTQSRKREIIEKIKQLVVNTSTM